MPEINGLELIAQEMKYLRDHWSAEKAERLTADETRKKEIDAKLTKIDERLDTLRKVEMKQAMLSLPGEYSRQGEKGKLSWLRMLQACVEPQRLNHPDYGVERDAINYVRNAAMNTGTGVSGGFLVPTTMREGIIPELRERSIARLLGATVITNLAPGQHSFAKSKGGITAQHLNTEGDQSGTDTVATFDQILLTARTIAAFVPLSRGMMNQVASPEMEAWTRGEIATQIALLQDKMFFVGTGSDAEPRGVLKHGSVQSATVDETSVKTIWKSLVDYILQSRNKNALGLTGFGWACGPRVLFALAKLRDTTDRPIFESLLSGANFAQARIPTQLLGYPIFDSAQLAGVGPTQERLAFGPWSQGIIAEWSTLELSMNDQSDTNFYKARGTVRGLADYDIGVFQPDTFSSSTEVDTDAIGTL